MSLAKCVFGTTTVLLGLMGLTTAASAVPCDECWAVAFPDGAKERGNHVAKMSRISDGVYEVKFGLAVSDCSWVGSIGNGQIGASAQPGFISISAKNNFTLTVKTFNTEGTATDSAFHVQVECK